MMILSLLAWAAIIIGYVVLTTWINNFCRRKFGRAFLTLPVFIWVSVCTAFFAGGGYWYQHATLNDGDTLNGLLLMGVGLVIVLGLYWYNIRTTNFLVGFIATTLVVGVFSTIAVVAAPLLIFLAIGCIALLFDTKPVWIINTRNTLWK